ncbi:hypothetical protein [Simplicispira suum]|uniref:Uncharacterized protein n=1 Tax=Simplicispira suum TaxID=2109915 RepID=A0A2S0N5R0_9BURK|nr:hypothetical protein [Simplicispira suum]AVO43480.1 hypothetical protein C6571_18830 [Simplicispira suum]
MKIVSKTRRFEPEMIERNEHDLNGIDVRQLKTGVLDVNLLKEAGLCVQPILNECRVVAVSYSGQTMNFSTKQREVLFHAKAVNGAYLGTYFANAFKALS